MKRLVRILLAAVGVLGLVVVAAVVYVTTFFDPNDLKPRLVEAVHEQTGLALSLDGPLNWSFYPRIGVSVEDARAWLPEQTREDEAFAAIDRGEVSLAFAPLLSGEIAIDGVTLDGMRLDLVRDQQGHGNWEQLLDRLGGSGDEAEGALAPASAGPSVQAPDNDPAVALDIASIEVRNSRVHYADRRSGLDLTVHDFSLTGSDVNPVNAFPLQTRFVVDSAAPDLSSQVDFKSKVRLGLNDGRYVLEGPSLETRTSLAAFKDREQTLDVEAKQLTADTRGGHYRLDGAQVDAELAHPSLGDKPLSLASSFGAEANTQEQTARLSDLSLTGDDGLKLTGALTFTQLSDTPHYSGQVKLAPLSLRPWLERLGVALDTADEDALSEVALTSPVKGDLSRATLSNLTLVVDATTLTGSLGAGLDGHSLSFDLQGDKLDLDAYLPPRTQEKGQDDTAALLRTLGVAPAYAATEAAQSADLVPAALLRDLSLDGQLALDSLKVKGLRLDKPSLALKGSGGRLSLERLDSRLYDGTLHAEAGLDVRQSPIRWTFSEKLDGVQLVPLVEDYSGKPSPLRGRLNVSGDFTSQTNRADTLLRNLDGKADFRVSDGAVFKVNVSKELCTAVAMLEGESTSRDWSPDTRFDQIKGSAKVVDGVIHNDDLLITIPGIELSGEGRVNLPTQRFDYDARARFVDTADAACKVNPRLEKVPLPVHCEGELSGEPGQWCAFDRQAFQKTLTKLAKDEAKKKAVDKLGEKLNEKLGDKSSEELRNAIRGLLK